MPATCSQRRIRRPSSPTMCSTTTRGSGREPQSANLLVQSRRRRTDLCRQRARERAWRGRRQHIHPERGGRLRRRVHTQPGAGRDREGRHRVRRRASGTADASIDNGSSVCPRRPAHDHAIAGGAVSNWADNRGADGSPITRERQARRPPQRPSWFRRRLFCRRRRIRRSRPILCCSRRRRSSRVTAGFPTTAR